jgi:hypothetical protein
LSAVFLASVRDFRRSAIANGYKLVRVKSGAKIPVGKEWQFGETAEILLRVTAETANTGVLCVGLRIVDIDVDDAVVAGQIIALVKQHLPSGGPIRRRDGSVRLGIIYRAASGAPTKLAVIGKNGKLEVLGAGQQLVAFGTHPTGATLRWLKDRSPANTPIKSLPAVTEEQIERFLLACRGPLGSEVTCTGNISPAPPAWRGTDSDLSAGIGSQPWFMGLSPEQKNGLVEACLASLDNRQSDPRERWLKVIFAVADAERQGCPDGYALALEWSKRGAGWTSEQDFDTAWNSAREGAVTVGSLIYLARQAGANLDRWLPAASASSGHSTQSGASGPVKSIRISELPAIPSKREWLHGTDIVRGAVTVLIAPGGKGKSTWSLTLGLAAASGRPLLGSHVFGGPLRVLYVSAEDAKEEVHRRLFASMQHHKLQPGDLETFRFVGAESAALALLEMERTAPRLCKESWGRLVAEIEAHNPDVLILDPLISFFGGASLNDNSAAGILFREFSRLAVKYNLGILVVHHVSKGREISSAEAAMGAASITNLSRSVLAIEALSASEAVNIGVMPSEAPSYFRVTSTKQNMSPPSDQDRWFKLVPVELPNAQPPIYPRGDQVAAVETFVPNATATGSTKAMQQAAISAIASASPPFSPGNRGQNSPFPAIQAAVAPYFRRPPTEADAKAILKHLFASGQVAIGTYQTPRKGHGGTPRQALVVPGYVPPATP